MVQEMQGGVVRTPLQTSLVLLDRLRDQQSTLNCITRGRYYKKEIRMLEIETPKDSDDADAPAPQYQVLFKFLTLSARADTSGAATESHLLASLAIALHSMGPQPQ